MRVVELLSSVFNCEALSWLWGGRLSRKSPRINRYPPHVCAQTHASTNYNHACTYHTHAQFKRKKAFGKQLLEKPKETFSADTTKLISLLIWWRSIFPCVSSLPTHNPDIHRHCHLLYLLDPTEMSLAIIWQVITVRNTQQPIFLHPSSVCFLWRPQNSVHFVKKYAYKYKKDSLKQRKRGAIITEEKIIWKMKTHNMSFKKFIKEGQLLCLPDNFHVHFLFL